MEYAEKVAQITELSDEDLAGLETEIVQAFDQADESDDLDAMASAADALDQVRAEMERRGSEEGSETMDEDKVPVAASAEADDKPEDKAVTASADDETKDETTSDDTVVASSDAEQTEEALTADATEGQEEAEVDIPKDRQPVATKPLVTVTAGADINGFSAGAEFTDSKQVAEAMTSRIHAISRASGGDGEQHIVASIQQRSVPEDRILSSSDAEGNRDKIASLVSPQAVTAAGWCAPLETKYDLFGVGVTDRPVRDALVGFQASRGGIRYTEAPVLSGYNDAIGVMAGADGAISDADGVLIAAGAGPKPCLQVDCGTEATAVADAVSLCLEFGNMASRAYPELVSRNNDLALIAHARFAEDRLLGQVKAGSTAVAVTTTWGTARDILVGMAKAAAAYRYKHRLNRNFPLRAIAPQFVLDVMREDLVVGLPGDMLQVADSLINQFFADRGISVSWHLDGLSTGAAWDGDTWNAFPATVEFGIFAEGTWLFLDGGTLDLGVVRDSTLVGTNSYKTFVETFEGTAKVGLDSLWVTAPVKTAGAVSGSIDPATLLA